MNKVIAGLLIATLGAGTLYAAQGSGWMHGKDKTLTRAEAQAHAGKMFDHIDTNRDGKLDAADRTARHAAMFDAIDTDRNGQISREEFAAKRPMGMGAGGPDHRMHGEEHGERGHHDRGPGMGRHDMGRHGMGHGGMGEAMVAMADANKDGAVSREEFAAAHSARFDRMDANKDGKVTGEERKAAHMAMRQAMHAAPGDASAPATKPSPAQ